MIGTKWYHFTREHLYLNFDFYLCFSKPLTFVNEKNQKKEAVAVFKLVQIYMSDRKAKVRLSINYYQSINNWLLIVQVGMTINSVAQDISETGYTTAGLRDEIYIQLCKQVINNILVMFWEQLFYLIFIRCQIIQGEKVYDEAGNCWVSLIYKIV